jgi:hypothetical protein
MAPTYPSKQRPILQSAKFDRYRFEQEKGKREIANFESHTKLLFPPPSDLYDYQVKEGDLLFGVRRFFNVRAPSVLNKGAVQQPVLSSCLNGLYIEKSKYDNLAEQIGDRKAELKCAYDSIIFCGFAYRPFVWDGKGLESVDGLVLQSGGTGRVLNNGPDTFEFGDYGVWSVPGKNDKQHSEVGAGHSNSSRKLHVRLLKNVCDLSIEHFLEFFDLMGIDTGMDPATIRRMLQESENNVDTMEYSYLSNLMLADDTSDGELHLFDEFLANLAKIQSPNTLSKRMNVIAGLNVMLNAQREDMEGVRARICIKAMRGGIPGEMMDANYIT